MPEPTVLIDRYEVRDLLGAGGSARVHLGYDRVLDRRVAIKLLDAAAAASADPAGHDRFVREARSAAGFSHPHAVATFDAGEDHGQLFIVMEYVDGVSLAQRIADGAPLAEPEIVHLGTQLLSALGAAHDAGIAHRDVKPANVLIDQTGDVKLTDFGIARRFDEITQALTVEGMVMGTVGYLAPERAQGLDGGPPADVYAVGAVLYEMATGRRAPASSRGGIPDPRVARPELSATVAATIMTALAREPEHRFPSAAAMTQALRGELPPTQLAVAEPAGTGVAAVPTAAMEARPTERMGSGVVHETALMPAQAAAPPRERSTVGWVLATLVLIGLIGVPLALARSDSTSTSAAPTSSSSPIATPETSAPSAATPPTSPATTAPPTTPPTTSPMTGAPAELIPGFAATDDVDQFVEQLRDRSSVAGKQSRKLGDALRDLRKPKNADKVDEEADELADKIDEWVSKDELDPTVAQRALEFIVVLVEG